MQILAIDCSAKSVSVAIAKNGNLIAEGFLNIKLTHSETLMPLCEQVLSNARLTLKDIEGFAITAGPGSFTGIRIGVSAVKGLAFGDKKPVFSFSTLEAMVLYLKGFYSADFIVCGLMDARRDQFYNALFDVNKGEVTRLCDDRTISIEALTDELKMEYANKKVILMGDGAGLFFENAHLSDNVTCAPEAFIVQRASGIAIEASRKDTNLKPLSPEALQPIYLRPSQAERERAEKESKD